MDKKQKEALIRALAEKGQSYREIAKQAHVSPNTIKAVLNRASLDESTSIQSRAFELFTEKKTPLQVAIELNLEAETAIKYHQEYFMLLGCTEHAFAIAKCCKTTQTNNHSVASRVKL